MSQNIMYKGASVPLIKESEYRIELTIGHYYRGLVLKDNGMLVFVNPFYESIGVSSNMGPLTVQPAIVVASPHETLVVDPELVAEAKRILEIKWNQPLSEANGWVGVAATGAEYAPNALRFIGGNMDIASKLASSASVLYRLGKGIGKASIFVGVGLDFVGYGIYLYNPNSPNSVSGYKLSLNSAITAYGAFVPGGVFASTLYFGVDALYPGGWKGALDNNAELQRQNEKIIPGFNLYEKQY